LTDQLAKEGQNQLVGQVKGFKNSACRRKGLAVSGDLSCIAFFKNLRAPFPQRAEFLKLNLKFLT